MRYEVAYAVLTGIDGSVANAGVVEVEADSYDAAEVEAIRVVHDTDPKADPRIDPKVRILEVAEIDD